MKKWFPIFRFIFYTFSVAQLTLLPSCVEEVGRKGRPLIKQFVEGEDEICSEAFVTETAQCLSVCPSGSHEASSDEVTTALNDINNSGTLTDASKKTYTSNINSAAKVCLPGSGILRPSGQVFIDKGFCACKDGKPIIINNCDSYCATAPTTSTPTLYGRVTLGPDVELNNDLGNLENWCNQEITGSDYKGPACKLEVFDGASTQYISLNIPADSNSFSASLVDLDENKTYVATLVENQSGSDARSDSFQIYMKTPDDGTGFVGPLKLTSISQYTCVQRPESTEGDSEYFEDYARLHFYFPNGNRPTSMAPGNPFVACHDVNQYGQNDSMLFPRLEEIPHHFALWDYTDLRFVDLDQDNSPDINKEIENQLAIDYGVTGQTINLFNLFSWPNRPNADSTPPNLGIYMQPWINEQSGRAFCPGQDEYHSNEPIFKILKELVGVPTEGVYLSEREPESYTTPDGQTSEKPQDVLIIRENLLKKIWFYIENGTPVKADEVTANNRTIHFYWPAADGVNEDPLTRQSDQSLYTVRAPDSIGKNGETTGLITTHRPPDKRFGCVPATD